MRSVLFAAVASVFLFGATPHVQAQALPANVLAEVTAANGDVTALLALIQRYPGLAATIAAVAVEAAPAELKFTLATSIVASVGADVAAEVAAAVVSAVPDDLKASVAANIVASVSADVSAVVAAAVVSAVPETLKTTVATSIVQSVGANVAAAVTAAVTKEVAKVDPTAVASITQAAVTANPTATDAIEREVAAATGGDGGTGQITPDDNTSPA